MPRSGAFLFIFMRQNIAHEKIFFVLFYVAHPLVEGIFPDQR